MFCFRRELTAALFRRRAPIGALAPLVALLLLLSLPLLQRHVVRFRVKVFPPVEVSPRVEVVVPLVAEARLVERVVVIPWEVTSREKREGERNHHIPPHRQYFADNSAMTS